MKSTRRLANVCLNPGYLKTNIITTPWICKKLRQKPLSTFAPQSILATILLRLNSMSATLWASGTYQKRALCRVEWCSGCAQLQTLRRPILTALLSTTLKRPMENDMAPNPLASVRLMARACTGKHLRTTAWQTCLPLPALGSSTQTTLLTPSTTSVMNTLDSREFGSLSATKMPLRQRRTRSTLDWTLSSPTSLKSAQLWMAALSKAPSANTDGDGILAGLEKEEASLPPKLLVSDIQYFVCVASPNDYKRQVRKLKHASKTSSNLRAARIAPKLACYGLTTSHGGIY